MDKQARINFLAVFAFAVVVAVLTMHFIFGANMAFSTPVSDTNLNFTTNLTYSVVYGAGIGNPTVTNITIYYNSSYNDSSDTNWIALTNLSGMQNATAASFNVSENDSNVFGTINLSGLPDARYYNFWIFIGNDTNTTNCSLGADANVNISLTVGIDSTAPEVTLLSPTPGANFSNATATYTDGELLFNATVYDAVMNISTVIFNLTNMSRMQVNASSYWYGHREGAGSNSWSNYSDFNMSQWKEMNYTLIVQAIDHTSTSNTNSSETTYNIYIDNTVPVSWPANFSTSSSRFPANPKSGHNLSEVGGLIDFNISLLESFISGSNPNAAWASSIKNVFFKVTTVNGSSANTYYTASKVGAGVFGWNASVNTSTLDDGNYTVMAIVNDSADNQNATADIAIFTIDNTSPSPTLSCTDEVVQGGDVTCTCTATDGGNSNTAVSGLNTSFGDGDGIAIFDPDGEQQTDSSPSWACENTGTYTVTCDVKDNAGNTGEITTTYSVVTGDDGSTSGGPSSSSPSSSSSETVSTVTAEESALVELDATEYGVHSIAISVTEEVSDVEVSIDKYEYRPTKVDSAKAGSVYRYLQIELENIGDALDKAVIRAKVTKAWVGSKNLEKEDIAVFKWAGGEWRMLPTTYDTEDDTAYYYDAEATAFSYFAIGEKKGELLLEPEEEQEIAIAEAKKEALKMWWYIGAAVIVIAIIAAAMANKKKLAGGKEGK